VTEGRKYDADSRYQRQSKRIANIGISQSKNRRHSSMEEKMMRNAAESDILDGDQWTSKTVCIGRWQLLHGKRDEMMETLLTLSRA